MSSAPHSPGDITRLLRAHHEGDREAFDRLVPLVYDRMRRIARGQLGRGGRGHTLSPTALVHEAYQQLVAETGVDWQDRSHFYGICARAMRRILVDYARMRKARKRGGALPHIALDADREIADVGSPTEVILAVDRAVDRLAAFNPRLAQIVECRSFAGMTEEETAQALGTLHVLTGLRPRLAGSAQQLRRDDDGAALGGGGCPSRRTARVSDLRAAREPQPAARGGARAIPAARRCARVQNVHAPPTSRTNAWVNNDVPELGEGAFSVDVQVLNYQPIAVEKALYWNAEGVVWAGGTNVTATMLPPP